MTAFRGAFLLAIVALFWEQTSQSSPPPKDQVAKMARYIIHNSDWVSVATVSQLSNITAYPFANLKSMSDGPIANGTGIPYLYISPLDFTGIDVEKDSRITILASLAESDYCKQENFDPQDPRCARVIISGHLAKVDKDSNEFIFAKYSLFQRHPAMKYWPIDHNWYIAKPNIELIIVLDFFGGAKFVSVEDYFNAYTKNTVFEDIEIIEVIKIYN